MVQDKTFIYRLIFGLTVFAILALVDYRRNPTNPRRIKEYSFLFSVAILSMIYGILHDFITYGISKEYYILGKGIESARNGFNFDVAKLALMATWPVGLIVGATFLIANNPRKLRRQLRYKVLFKLLFIPLTFSAGFAFILGTVFYLNQEFFAKLGHLEDLNSLCSNPSGFITVWGIHNGSYLGGLIGLIIALVIILKMKGKIV